MDVLGFFVIRTGFPFGYLLAAVGLLAAAAAGVFQLWRGARTRSVRRLLAGGALLAGAALVVAANLAYEAALDLNPVVDAADLAGPWRDGRATLELGADGAYRCRGGRACAPLGAAGRWAHDGDFLLRFTRAPDGRVVVQRVVRYGAQLRLTEDADEPDSWSGVMTFARPAPAS